MGGCACGGWAYIKLNACGAKVCPAPAAAPASSRSSPPSMPLGVLQRLTMAGVGGGKAVFFYLICEPAAKTHPPDPPRRLLSGSGSPLIKLTPKIGG